MGNAPDYVTPEELEPYHIHVSWPAAETEAKKNWLVASDVNWTVKAEMLPTFKYWNSVWKTSAVMGGLEEYNPTAISE